MLSFHCRTDYLLISHFLLNLQEISTVESDRSDAFRSSSVRTSQAQVSSVRFAENVIGNLGEPLRDGWHEDEDEHYDDGNNNESSLDIVYAAHADTSLRDHEKASLRASLSDSIGVWKEDFVVLSKIPASQTV